MKIFSQTTYVVVFLSLAKVNLLAQPTCPEFKPAWTWINGSKTGNSSGVYGTMGVESTENSPRSRFRSMSWNGRDGNLWLFGGEGRDSTGYYSGLDDLWKFNQSTNAWTWVRGSYYGSSRAIHGVQGESNPNNYPGTRQSSNCWTDNDGCLWLFGGLGSVSSGHSVMNDLWKYDPETNLWMWVKGSNQLAQPGVYGIQKVGNESSVPGARSGSACWTDANGCFWMYGGAGIDENGNRGVLNDCWRYDPVVNVWTWMSGQSIINQRPVYGEMGVADASNTPGARDGFGYWTGLDNCFYLFGGSLYFAVGFAADGNDLWKYDPTANTWTWIKGSKTYNQRGSYGAIDEEDTDNLPGSRYSTVSARTSANEAFLFGGTGMNENEWSYLNDLWRYNHLTNNWTWISGVKNIKNPQGNYGIKGLTDVNSIPGSRSESAFWPGEDNSIWLMGGIIQVGSSLEQMNDLWCFSKVVHATTNQNEARLVSPSNILDVSGNAELVIITGPEHGVVSLKDNTTQTLHYKPNSGWSGTDNFVIGLSNAECLQSTTTVRVNVRPSLSNVEQFQIY